MTKNNVLLLVDNEEKLKALKGEENVTFLFPVKDFTVGFPSPFSILNIKEEGYIFVNRVLDNKGIENFKQFLRDLPSNIKGIVFDDIGVLNVLLEENSSLIKILFLNHMNSNYESINAYLEYVDSVVVSTDITVDEVSEILSMANKPVVLYTFGHMNIMYSRRTLITNYNKHFHMEEERVSSLEEITSHQKFQAVENEYGTVLYTKEPFNGLALLELDKKNILFYLINTLFLDTSEVKELLQDPKACISKYPYKYLSEEETIFKLKEEEK